MGDFAPRAFSTLIVIVLLLSCVRPPSWCDVGLPQERLLDFSFPNQTKPQTRDLATRHDAKQLQIR